MKSMDFQVEVSKRLEREIRNEAIKDFAERLKTTKAMHYCKCGKTIDTTQMINDYIDTLVIEITGGD